jgi:N-acetylglucosaminyl-diphospho-decaprenol L-rhamnosyltransferase
MKAPTVAVVIVTYRTAELTVDCLRSLADERGTNDLNITAIVVDTSSDDFLFIQKAIEENEWGDWVKLNCASRNGGFAYGNNIGIQIASRDVAPDYIHLLNPDTLVRKGAILSLVQFLEARSSAGIAGSSFENLDGSDWPIAFRFPTILSEMEEGLQFGIASKLLRRWVVARKMGKLPEPTDWIPGASMMIRKAVFDSIGTLDEGYFLYFEETDFCFRAQQKGFETWYVPDSRVMHIAGQSTKVTERDAKTKRLPPYWFQSRRRFFVKTYGRWYAILTDIVALFSRVLGMVKRVIFRQTDRGIPFFISDLVRYSAVWPRNAISKMRRKELPLFHGDS